MIFKIYFFILSIDKQLFSKIKLRYEKDLTMFIYVIIYYLVAKYNKKGLNSLISLSNHYF